MLSLEPLMRGRPTQEAGVEEAMVTVIGRCVVGWKEGRRCDGEGWECFACVTRSRALVRHLYKASRRTSS